MGILFRRLKPGEILNLNNGQSVENLSANSVKLLFKSDAPDESDCQSTDSRAQEAPVDSIQLNGTNGKPKNSR
jgi:hypothetical protein